jgi:photosystem II stability/assembly factor-like uncharacterized protein
MLLGFAASGQSARLAEAGDSPRHLDRILLLDAAQAGKRLVAVGERGRILISDDDGRAWRYARSPTEATLTAVYFVDAAHGWAVGHDGVILRTEDGGATWQQTRIALEENAPLLDVWFQDATHGFAVGAYGTALETNDGGATWNRIRIGEGDAHFNAIAGTRDGLIYLVGEAGTVARSDDGGRSWSKLSPPYAGSFFGVLILPGAGPLIFGLRGNAFRGAADGQSWQAVKTGTDATLQGGSLTPSGEVFLVGSDGVILASRDAGASFALARSPGRRALAAVIPDMQGDLLLFGEGGVSRSPHRD